MHPRQRPALRQQQRIVHHVGNTDSYAFFNLLTDPQLFDEVEALAGIVVPAKLRIECREEPILAHPTVLPETAAVGYHPQTTQGHKGKDEDS